MNTKLAHDFLFPATLALFPARYNTAPARAMMLTTGDQESDFTHREQLVGARQWWNSTSLIAASFWMFELSAVTRVLNHYTVGALAKHVCEILGYPPIPEVVHRAMVHNDILAVAFARLLIYTYPGPLPGPDQPTEAWNQYIACWRPGKPRPERWNERYSRAWDIVRAAA